jgi:hypothetical protein
MRKLSILLAVLLVFFGVNAFASTNKPLTNAGEGLKEMASAGSSAPVCAKNTGTKAVVPCNDCAPKTSDAVGKGIARFVGGLLKVATFWCPEGDNTTMVAAASHSESATK